MKNYAKISNRLTLDKNNEVPYYAQLKKIIIKEIESGKWKVGQQILPETLVCEKFDISRTVVRQAFQELASEGYLIKKKARGTYIAEAKINENLVQSLVGFYEDMVSKGYSVKNKIFIQKVITANANISKYLKIGPDEKVIILKRLRSLNNEPLILVTTFIPYNMCPKILTEDFSKKSLYIFLREEYNLEIHRGIKFIEATVTDEEKANLFGIKKGMPLLYLESISYLDDDTPLEYYEAFHRGDRFRLVTELQRFREVADKVNPISKRIDSGIILKDKK